MLEERSLKLDVVALALLGLTIFLAAALVSYDPADPPSKLVYPERAETLNLCGRSGAAVSRVMFEAFGAGAYYVLVSLLVFDAVLLARRGVRVRGEYRFCFGRKAAQYLRVGTKELRLDLAGLSGAENELAYLSLGFFKVLVEVILDIDIERVDVGRIIEFDQKLRVGAVGFFRCVR